MRQQISRRVPNGFRRPRQDFGAQRPLRDKLDVPEYAELVRRAARDGTSYETRFELYDKMRLSDEEKVAVEAKVVRHVSHDILDDVLLARVVRYNLFYMGFSEYKGDIFKDDLLKAYSDSTSMLDMSERLGIVSTTGVDMLRRLGITELQWKAKPRPTRVEKKVHVIRVKEVKPEPVPIQQDGELNDAQKKIVGEAFTNHLRLKEAAQMARVKPELIYGLWSELAIEMRSREMNGKHATLTIRR